MNIEENIFNLHSLLVSGNYKHGSYKKFTICDPKRREIHKASVRDRVLHHTIFRILEPVFDKGFIHDSFSSRKTKGIHKAHDRFAKLAWKLSRNNTRTVWVLKCDIRKFFDSIDHEILKRILGKKIANKSLVLLSEIINSFEKTRGKGIPIGNLTSQLFSNIYLNEFDQFVKRELRVKNYIRYADDFVILSYDKTHLTYMRDSVNVYLRETLKLELHSNKVITRKFNQGIDFLGYVIFPHHRVLRTKTKKRMLRNVTDKTKMLKEERVSENSHYQTTQSYLGLLKHCQGHELERKIASICKNL